jgi:hypothetical protein
MLLGQQLGMYFAGEGPIHLLNIGFLTSIYLQWIGIPSK